MDIVVTGTQPVSPFWCMVGHLEIIINMFLALREFPAATKSGRLHLEFGAYKQTDCALDYMFVLEASLLVASPTAAMVTHCGTNAVIPQEFKCKLYFINRTMLSSGLNIFVSTCELRFIPGCGSNAISFQNECFELEGPIEYVKRMSRCQNKQFAAFLNSNLRTLVAKQVSEYRFVYSEFRDLIGDLDNVLWLLTGVQKVLIGDSFVDNMYRFLWFWKDYKVVVHDSNDLRFVVNITSASDMAVLRVDYFGNIHLNDIQDHSKNVFVLCHQYNSQRQAMFRSKILLISQEVPPSSKFPAKLCPRGGYYVHHFHSCEFIIGASSSVSSSGLHLFLCRNGLSVHYTLTCDGFDDCRDNSDEHGCSFAKEWLKKVPGGDTWYFCTTSLEAVDIAARCDGKPDCMDGSDEQHCTLCHGSESPFFAGALRHICLPRNRSHCAASVSQYEIKKRMMQDPLTRWYTVPSLLDDLKPWLVEMDGCGGSNLLPWNHSECPETHVRCPDAYCIPTYLLNNGVYDCPHLETDDEHVAEKFSCPGHYRCYRSHICVHDRYLCDGVFHCPYKDDERYCDFLRACPEFCRCEGLAMVCSRAVDMARYRQVRYLDISRTDAGFVVGQLFWMPFLQFLNVSRCQLLNLSLNYIDNLKVLDLSHNDLRTLNITGRVSLTQVNLSGNPLLFANGELGTNFLCSLGPQLKSLSLKNSGLQYIEPAVFTCLPALDRLDVQHNSLSLTKDTFTGLSGLQSLETSDSLACCIFNYVYPTSKADCLAPRDLISSCTDLLGSNFVRAFLWILCLMAVLGNSSVIVYRLFFEDKRNLTAYRILVSSLCFSDAVMGMYLLTIGSADLYFKGRYMTESKEWKSSRTCSVAGVLGLLSNEVSALIVCLITLDRLLVLRFPFHRHLHINSKSAFVLSCCTWIFGGVVILVPLLHKEWQFYNNSGICIPLPVNGRYSQHQIAGELYSFAIFICFNSALVILTSLGQLVIYVTVHGTPAAGRTDKRQQDLVVARRLFLIVFADICCWIPVGAMGLLARAGIAIPEEMSVWMAVLVLPLNAALNPFLYTLSTALERRRKVREQQRVRLMMATLHSGITALPDDRAQLLLQGLLRSHAGLVHKVLTADQVLEALLAANLKAWSPQQQLQLRQLTEDQQ